MRAVIRRDNFKIEFTGRGETWNDLLRPYLGGPPAPPEPAFEPRTQPAAPAPQPAPAPAPPPGPVVRYVAGPAPVAVASAAATANRPAPSQPRTWYPPRAPQPVQRFDPRPVSAPTALEGDDDSMQVEPSADPTTLYQRLAAIPGRRSERDAVLAAVWFLTKGEREATADEVEAHLDAHQAFPDIKVVPHMLKHVHRTKMFEQGSSAKAVKLSAKGRASVRGRLVPE